MKRKRIGYILIMVLMISCGFSAGCAGKEDVVDSESTQVEVTEEITESTEEVVSESTEAAESESAAETVGETAVEIETESETELITELVTEEMIEGIPFEVVSDQERAASMLSQLENSGVWHSGSVNTKTARIVEGDSVLTLEQYLMVDAGSYVFRISDKKIRLIVYEFDENGRYLGYVDGCNEDILTLKEKCRFLAFSIYMYENRSIAENGSIRLEESLGSGLSLSLEKIVDISVIDANKEVLSSEIHVESLSNRGNYRSGWYKGWGGAFEAGAGSLGSRNYYGVDSEEYKININDSRVVISISEFDAEGKWLNNLSDLGNGATFKKQDGTAYIGITVRSLKWGVDLTSLLENGLRIDFAKEQYIDETPTIEIKNAVISDMDHWKPGSYLYETGDFIIQNDRLCYEAFLKMDDDAYKVQLPVGYLKMNVLELTADGTGIASYDLQNGQSYVPSENTYKIAISIFDSGKTMTVENIKEVLASEEGFGLVIKENYEHNTVMGKLTAKAFIEEMNVGWNLGNSFDSKSTESSKTANLKQELNWGNPYVSEELISYVAECGFNTIRIPVTWNYNTYRDENGRLRINEAWLERVSEVVDYALDNNLYVIINAHHEQPVFFAGVDETAMGQVLSDAEDIWGDIAAYFRTYDEHLIFEGYNEVDNLERSWNYSDKAAAQMNRLNQVFVDTVRESGGNNSERILMVPTLLDGTGSKFYNAFVLPEDTAEDKLIIQVHMYTKKFNQDVDAEFAEMEAFAVSQGVPVIIGEFGTTNGYPYGEIRAEQASNFVARAAKHGIKCIWWDNGSDYAIINRRNLQASNLEMIQGLLEGSEGAAYKIEDETVLNQLEQFVYEMPNNETGLLSYQYWGTITSDIKGKGIEVKEGENYSVSLRTEGDAFGLWIQRVLFYDADGNLVQKGTELQSKYGTGIVPENAVTMRISINSPTVDTKLENFNQYFKDNNLELIIRFFDFEDLKEDLLF